MGVSDGDSFSYVLLHYSYISATLQLYFCYITAIFLLHYSYISATLQLCYSLNPKPMVIG